MWYVDPSRRTKGAHTVVKVCKTTPCLVQATPSGDVASKMLDWDPSDPQYHILYEPSGSSRTEGFLAQTESGEPGGPLPSTIPRLANPVPFWRSCNSPGAIAATSWRVPPVKSATVVSVQESARTGRERIGTNWRIMRRTELSNPTRRQLV